MNRRRFLQQGLGVSAGLLAPGLPRWAPRAVAAEARWRTFEVVTRVEPADPAGEARVWVPVPLMADTDYFRRLGDTWKGTRRRCGWPATRSTTPASSTRSGRPPRKRRARGDQPVQHA